MTQTLRCFILLCLWLLVGATPAQAASFTQLSDADWQLLSHSPGILVGGPRKAAIQVVFDPNCPASAHLYQYLRKTRRTTPIRWVPVAHYQQNSLGKAAALLQAPDPAQALDHNFEHYDYRTQMGATTPVSPPPGLKILLEAMEARLNRWIGATPVMVARTPDGQVLMNDLGNRPEYIKRLLERADGLKAY